MFDFLKKIFSITISIITLIFTFIPEKCFSLVKLPNVKLDEINIIFNRVLLMIIVFCIVVIFYSIFRAIKWRTTLKGHGYKIIVEYGNILKKSKGKKVINFDECFTTSVGHSPWDVRDTSICGQYLLENPIHNMQELIDKNGLKPASEKSLFDNKDRYSSGILIPKGDYLLMAFAPLDKDGRAHFFSREKYLDSLSTLWNEIDKYYEQKDVYIPLLGAGITRFEDKSLNQQELLDMIIYSYKLSSHKIKSPYKLHIVCKRDGDFSINKIGVAL